MKTQHDAFTFLCDLSDELKTKNHLDAVKHLEFLLQGAGASTWFERVTDTAMGLGTFLEKYGDLIDDLQKQKIQKAKEIYLNMVEDPSIR